MPYTIGDVVPLGITTYNDTTGDPEDALSVTLSVTLPDGTTASPSVTHVAATGVYTCNYTTAQAGRYRYTFTVTGTASVTGGVDTDVFDVLPANPRFIISLEDAKTQLKIPAGVSTNDDDLRLYCAAATDYIEAITGPLLSVTGKTRTFDGGGDCVLLPEPASSVTSVTVDGSSVSYKPDLAAGIVWAGSDGSSSFTAGRANVVVTYTVGGSTVPPAAVLAARKLVRYWYATTQQGGRPAFGSNEPAQGEVFFPEREVREILRPITDAMPGLA